MKRWRILLVAFCLFLVYCAGALPIRPPLPGTVIVYAQSLPITKTVVWTASVVDATHAAPDNYVVKLDSVTIGSPTTTSQSVTFTTLGSHVVTVTAVNSWGSATATLNVLVAPPNTPTALVIQ